MRRAAGTIPEHGAGAGRLETVGLALRAEHPKLGKPRGTVGFCATLAVVEPLQRQLVLAFHRRSAREPQRDGGVGAAAGERGLEVGASLFPVGEQFGGAPLEFPVGTVFLRCVEDARRFDLHQAAGHFRLPLA